MAPVVLIVLCCRVSSFLRGKPYICVTATVMMPAVDITPEMSQVLKQKGILVTLTGFNKLYNYQLISMNCTCVITEACKD